MSERTEILTAAIAATLKAGRAVNVKNIRKAVPTDFFWDFDNDAPLDSNVVFQEIQDVHAAMPHAQPMIATAPTGAALPDMPPIDDSELLGVQGANTEEIPESELLDGLAPSPMPVAETAQTATDDDVSHGASVRPLSPQARLDAARETERELIGKIPLLKAAEADARAKLAAAIRAFQESDPTRQTPESLRREFIANSNAERAARAAGQPWATRPARERSGHISPLDAERIYSQGGDANSFARRMAQTGSARGAFTKREAAMRGFVNTDPRRGAVLAQPAEPKPAVPMLADK